MVVAGVAGIPDLYNILLPDRRRNGFFHAHHLFTITAATSRDIQNKCALFIVMPFMSPAWTAAATYPCSPRWTLPAARRGVWWFISWRRHRHQFRHVVYGHRTLLRHHRWRCTCGGGCHCRFETPLLLPYEIGPSLRLPLFPTPRLIPRTLHGDGTSSIPDILQACVVTVAAQPE